jgi:SAM-dependent methyltransferase
MSFGRCGWSVTRSVVDNGARQLADLAMDLRLGQLERPGATPLDTVGRTYRVGAALIERKSTLPTAMMCMSRTEASCVRSHDKSPTIDYYVRSVTDDAWTSRSLADRFVDEAYATVKGYVRTYVMHQQLLENLPPAPAQVLDVGGGAGHQSFPLAEVGYDVTLLDLSPAMLDKARQRLDRLPDEVRDRVTLLEADGRDADEAVNGRRFDAALCHGVLGYLEDPVPMVDQLCRCVAPHGVVSIMTGNAKASAVQPALERRWQDALAAFDTAHGIGVLGVRGRADTVDELSQLMHGRGVQTLRWYGVWLFIDWLEFSGVKLDPTDTSQVAATAAVELEASRRDPYRQLSRVFHLVGRKDVG